MRRLPAGDFRRARRVLSLLALCVAVLICRHQQHFHLYLNQPNTFLLPFQHRCGWVLILRVGWVLLEAVELVVGGSRRLSAGAA